MRRTLLLVIVTTVETARPSLAQNVVLDWNRIATPAIVPGAANHRLPPLANGFLPFYFNGEAPDGTSVEAAGIAAAHRLLVHYFPARLIDARQGNFNNWARPPTIGIKAGWATHPHIPIPCRA